MPARAAMMMAPATAHGAELCCVLVSAAASVDGTSCVSAGLSRAPASGLSSVVVDAGRSRLPGHRPSEDPFIASDSSTIARQAERNLKAAVENCEDFMKMQDDALCFTG